MKKVKLVLMALPITLLLMSSCKKKIYGCMDKTALNYSEVATLDAGNCVYQEEEVIISNTLTNIAWTQQSTWWQVNLIWEEITQDVIDNGAVDVYASDGSDWTPLPTTLFLSSSYSTIINLSYSVGKVEITWEDSDGTLPLEPGPMDFKMVILK